MMQQAPIPVGGGQLSKGGRLTMAGTKVCKAGLSSDRWMKHTAVKSEPEVIADPRGTAVNGEKAAAKPGSSQAKFWEAVAPSPLVNLQEGNLVGTLPGIGPYLSPSKSRRTDSGDQFSLMGK